MPSTWGLFACATKSTTHSGFTEYLPIPRTRQRVGTSPGGPTRLEVERVLASMLSVIHTWHGDPAWEIYRDKAPELADYRAFVDRLKALPKEGR